MSGHEQRRSKWRRFLRAFRPFWITAACGALILLWDYHLKQSSLARITSSVTVEGRNPVDGFSVAVNGVPHDLDSPPPLGRAVITLSAPGAESREFKRFIWYGENWLGRVNLPWRRGSVVLQVLPSPDSYELVGKRGGWTNNTGSFTNVPVGPYHLTSRFGSYSNEGELEVSDGQSSFKITAQIGSLRLSSEPPDGEFVLENVKSGQTWRGRFPASYARLPSGEYRLVATRADYQRALNLEVPQNSTNGYVTRFTYGGAKFVTEPLGAQVWSRAELLGETPLELTKLIPETYGIRVVLDGYDTVRLHMVVESDTTTNVVLSLVNTRYREAMETAQQMLSSDDPEEALKYLQTALTAVPGDAKAVEMLPAARNRAAKKQAQRFAESGEFGPALAAIEAALTALPNDPEAAALKESIKTAKSRAEAVQSRDRFSQLIGAAKSAASQKKFDVALERLREAKALQPDDASLGPIEEEIGRSQAQYAAERADEKRKADLKARVDKFRSFWEAFLASEKDSDSFPQNNWTSTKSIPEIRAALEQIGERQSIFKVRQSMDSVPDQLLATLGRISPGLDAGQYIKFGAITTAAGHTEIRIKLFEYRQGRPQWEADQLKARVFEFRGLLSKQLNGNLKIP